MKNKINKIKQIWFFLHSIHVVNAQTMNSIQIKTKHYLVSLFSIIGTISIIALITGMITQKRIISGDYIKYLAPEEVTYIISSSDSFSEQRLIEYTKHLHIRHPHIYLAQCWIESGYFTSDIWKENKNPQGMRQALARPTTALGTKRGHAEFNNWRDAVVDYALWQAAYANIKDEKKYLAYIRARYAEDPTYYDKVVKLLPIAKKRIEQSNNNKEYEKLVVDVLSKKTR